MTPTTTAAPTRKRAPKTYRPFIVGLCFVFTATLVLSCIGSAGMLDVHYVMDAFMACFFITFAVPKFLNLTGFARAFQQYDSISQKFPQYALAYPFIELALGLALLSNLSMRPGSFNTIINMVIIVTSGLTLLGVTRALHQKKQLDCACMGTSLAFPLSSVTVIENGAMLLMAATMLAAGGSSHMIALAQYQIML